MLEIIEGDKKEIRAYDLLLLLFCEAERQNIEIRTQDLLKTIIALANEYPEFFDEWVFEIDTYIICEKFKDYLWVYQLSGLITCNVSTYFFNEKILLNVSVEAIEINYKDLSSESRDEANKVIEKIFQGLEKLKQKSQS